MEFTVGDYVRMGFGFANPNHAAALFCAFMPFCWGWKSNRWLGWLICSAMAVALAQTFSRTGFVILAFEMVLWRVLCRKACAGDTLRGWRLALVVTVVIGSICWMAPRLTLDGAILNRPRVWLAGLRLWLANPWGVGFGNSGILATSFLLPEGVEVRTLVNSHLTLLVELGAAWGALWMGFVCLASVCGKGHPRMRLSFMGLALSACTSTVFDWHLLLSSSMANSSGALNLVMAWVLLAVFFGTGIFLIVRGVSLRRIGATVAIVSVGLCALLLMPVSPEVPRVASGYVRYGADGPVVMHDRSWSLKTLRKQLPEGATIRIAPGVDHTVGDVSRGLWLYGEVAESSHRFPEAEITVIGAPEFYEPGTNVKRVVREESN